MSMETGNTMTLLLSFLIGVFTGLRSLTPTAMVAWAVHLGWLRPGRPLALIGSLPAVAILSVLAVAEFVADKLPNTPNRTSTVGLIARIVMGGIAGACVSSSGGHGVALGAVLGAIGGIAGAFGGYHARARLVRALGTPDIYIALLEDFVAIGGAFWVVTRF
jgi:uncharacterized membrane protein